MNSFVEVTSDSLNLTSIDIFEGFPVYYFLAL
jgi:hypothetical protein